MIKDGTLEVINELKAAGLDGNEMVAYAILKLSESVDNVADKSESLTAILSWALGQHGHDNIPAAIRGEGV